MYAPRDNRVSHSVPSANFVGHEGRDKWWGLDHDIDLVSAADHNDAVFEGASRCPHFLLEGHRSGAVCLQRIGSATGNGDYLLLVTAGAGKISLARAIQCEDTDGGVKSFGVRSQAAQQAVIAFDRCERAAGGGILIVLGVCVNHAARFSQAVENNPYQSCENR